jgi:anthranilate phosphoribosyltransferase
MTLGLIGRATAGEDLGRQEIADAFDGIMEGSWSDEQIALLLTALHHKGETVEEIAGAAEAMRRHMTKIHSDRPDLLDTCGTGGDGSGTFNISTAAAIVTAAAGVAIAKHGNRSITSKTGSADVLRELGVNVEASVSQAETCLREVGICFCFAPLLHPSMRHVAQVRRQLGFRTIFNLLGPLCNPADAQFQLLGVGQPELRPLLAGALQQLGTTRAVVVCGDDGLDEVTLRGITRCTQVDTSGYSEFTWTPQDFDLSPTSDFGPLEVDGPAASAHVIRTILAGQSGPATDIVVLNAAAALWTAGRGTGTAGRGTGTAGRADARTCTKLAQEAIASGAAAATLAKLVEWSHA